MKARIFALPFALLFLSFAIFLAATISIGCTYAERAHLSSMGKNHRVTLYSGGVKVGQWEARGQVQNEAHSDGFQFEDAATGKLIEVQGTCLVEQE